MSVTIEWVNDIGIVRAGEDHYKHGDPYDFVCTILIKSRYEVYIVAACGKFSKKIFHEIQERLLKLGIDKATWERKKKSFDRKVVYITKERE